MSFSDYAQSQQGSIYPRISSSETPTQVAISTTPDLDGPIYTAASVSLIDVLVYHFFGVRELGFCPFVFLFSTDNDPIDILVISSAMLTGLNGDSRSLEISTVIGSLYMPHQFPAILNQSCTLSSLRNSLKSL